MMTVVVYATMYNMQIILKTHAETVYQAQSINIISLSFICVTLIKQELVLAEMHALNYFIICEFCIKIGTNLSYFQHKNVNLKIIFIINILN